MNEQRREMTPLRAARTAKGLTLVQLARKARITYTTAQALDSGKREGEIPTMIKISAAMGDKNFNLWPESRRDLRRVKRLMESL